MKNKNLIILAAGKPNHGNLPILLTEVNGQMLFDWQLNALSGFENTIPQVVVGFSSEQFENLSERAEIYTNEKWHITGSAYSLLKANLSGDSTIVSYADILYRPIIIDRLNKSKSDITIAYDSLWKQRYIGRPKNDLTNTEKVIVSKSSLLKTGPEVSVESADGEFIGLVHFQGNAMSFLRDLQNKRDESLEKISLPDLIELMRLKGLSSSVIDVEGDWAELNEAKDVAHFILGTKAETLDRLSNMVSKSIVLDQFSFQVSDWNNDSSNILEKISKAFHNTRVVVRSSAKSEDAFTQSNAGAYTSILDVDPKNGLREAISEVINSYHDCQSDDQVLVQPMLRNISLSGVAFTCSLEEGAPFYIVNYDESGSTEGITSGTSQNHKSLYLRRDASLEDLPDKILLEVMEAIQEVEIALGYDALDIEFAQDKSGKVYLLQVRPITTVDEIVSDDVAHKIVNLQKNASNYWHSLQAKSPRIKGDKAIFGVMPDWNPAEIIGTNPGKLAVSLYEYLILNDVWAKQRAQYGYKDVRPQPLLRNFAGKPYIDVRASFNSFTPNDLSQELTNKLINFYITWLEDHPYLHDKVEFDVMPTCFGPMFSKWEKRLSEKAHLDENEISQLKSGLLKITQEGIKRNKKDFYNLDILEKYNKEIIENEKLSNIEKVRLLLDYCKKYGTLPFSHLARSGFVAVTMLREGVEAGWLDDQAKEGFMESVHTVSHELGSDAWKVKQDKMSWDNFVSKYGHLRPGTYDISSPAYSDNPEQFLRPLIECAKKPSAQSKKVNEWQKQKKYFFNKLRSNGLDIDDKEFEKFLIEAIEGREKGKFIFSRSLSKSLSLLIEEGKKYNLTADDLANLSLTDLFTTFNLNISDDDKHAFLTNLSKKNLQDRAISRACYLPPLLCGPNDFVAFIRTEEKPNFIGTSRITAEAIHLDEGSHKIEIENSIVIIPQADPGYDWLFGQKILGLITMYGGANSHMAIRAAEFGLPAAIGVGEQVYKNCCNAKIIELDAAGETIRVIQ